MIGHQILTIFFYLFLRLLMDHDHVFLLLNFIPINFHFLCDVNLCNMCIFQLIIGHHGVAFAVLRSPPKMIINTTFL